eukprot:135667-Alexandrium_andersonii.AAC.1
MPHSAGAGSPASLTGSAANCPQVARSSLACPSLGSDKPVRHDSHCYGMRIATRPVSPRWGSCAHTPRLVLRACSRARYIAASGLSAQSGAELTA